MTKVFVTGASGFIAKHILRELFNKGYEVRASIRSDRRKAEIEALFPGKTIEFAYLDLEKDDGWNEAMQGCDVLMHTASPFPMADPKDPQDLIRPAVEGTLRAMKAAKAAGIKRVILTSSNAAIYKEKGKAIDAPSNETNWTDPEGSATSAYEASKTLAEKAAWNFVGENTDMSLTTINPGAVFGPAMDAKYGTSLELVERAMKGQDPMAPPMELPMVDVRDVAMLHVAAIDLDASKGERFSATSETLTFQKMNQLLREIDPTLKAPTKVAPLWLLRVFSLFMPEVKGVLQNIGRSLTVSGAKAEKVFGFTWIPVKDSLAASVESIRSFRP